MCRDVVRQCHLDCSLYQHKTAYEMRISDWSSDVCSSDLEAELAEVPAFTDSTIHIVSGLLLPIWKRLPNESTRVYRLQTDTGERIVGRRVSPAWVAGATATGGSTLSPDHAFPALMDVRTLLHLAKGLQLRRSRVMAVNRIELTGSTHALPPTP